MAQADRHRDHDRIKSAIAVLIFHLLLGYALTLGLRSQPVSKPGDELKLFDVREVPPPPPEEPGSPPDQAVEEERAASPPNLRAEPTPIVSPPAEVRLERLPPVVSSPAPGQGSDPDVGASDLPGPGQGSGGEGSGTGSGRRGRGSGDGGIAIGAEWIAGRIRDSDYPRSAGRAGIGGTVIVRFSVGVDGRPGDCRVMKSSGHAELDATTCGLIERRFRYAPARDADGNPVPDIKGWKQIWWLE